MFAIWNQAAKGYYTGEAYVAWTGRSFEFVDEAKDAKQFESQELASAWVTKRLLGAALTLKDAPNIQIKEV